MKKSEIKFKFLKSEFYLVNYCSLLLKYIRIEEIKNMEFYLFYF